MSDMPNQIPDPEPTKVPADPIMGVPPAQPGEDPGIADGGAAPGGDAPI